MTAAPPLPAPKLWRAGTLVYTAGGLALLFCWLLWGDFAWSMRDRTVPAVIQLLLRRFGASDTLTGILFTSLPSALGLVLGPIVGYRSDRYRSRWGRRIPFLFLPTPFIVLSMVGLAFAPQIGGAAHRLLGPEAVSADAAVLACLGICWAVFEIACLTANAVFMALINDVVPQAVMGRFFGLFRACSLVCGMILTYWVMGKAETHYRLIFLGVGVLYGLGFTLMCLRVKEGEYPPPPEPKAAERARLGSVVAGVRAYFRDSFAKPYYLLVFLAPICCGLATLPFNLYSLFYAKSLGMNLDVYFKCLTLTYGISLVLAYPLGALADRFHPLRISLVVIALYGGVMAWGMASVKDAATFAVILVAHGVLSGTFYTTSASLGQRLLPQAKFAELSSAGGILNGVVMMIVPVLLGTLLDRTHHTYRYVFHAGLGLSVFGVLLGVALYRRFVALGGPSHYQAPE